MNQKITKTEIFSTFKSYYDVSNIVKLSDENLLELCEYFEYNQDDEALTESTAWDFAYMMYCNITNDNYETDENGIIYM